MILCMFYCDKSSRLWTDWSWRYR